MTAPTVNNDVLTGRYLHIAGSAHATCPDEKLRHARDFVTQLVPSWLAADGRFVVFLGAEPRKVELDHATALTFDWLVLELLRAAFAEGGPPTDAVCVAVLSCESPQKRFPADRLGLLQDLVTTGAVSLNFIDEERHVGGYIRQRIAESSDVLAAIGGGKGVTDLHGHFATRGAPSIPFDIEIGASCADGPGAVKLNRAAFTQPEAFLKHESQLLKNYLLSISLESASNALPRVVSRLLTLIRAEFESQQRERNIPQLSTSQPLRVLVVASDPQDQDELDLNEEGMSIVELILDGIAADSLSLQVLRKATPDSVRQKMAKCRPNIVQFSGHGSKDGIALRNSSGGTSFVDGNALKQLLAVFSADVRLVVLNSCSSSALAEQITDVIDFAIGMQASVPDDTAIAFSQGLFDGLANGLSVEKAFELGRANCTMKNTLTPDLPILYVRAGLTAGNVVLAPRP